MTTEHLGLREEAQQLAHRLFGNETERVSKFVDRVLDTCVRARGKDFLLIHNPGGWGNKTFDHCLQWERNVVNGVSATIERLGYTSLLMQYFRSGTGWREWMHDAREQFSFFLTKARIMAAEVEFITRHVDNLKVLLIGVSQGAGFSNAVMQQLNELRRIYGIEVGIFFPYMSRRVLTERTLALDWNGIVPDAAVRRDMLVGARAYLAAPLRWLKYRLQGRSVKLSSCVNIRGHNYDWGYPYVRRRVTGFLEANFGSKQIGSEVGGVS